MYDISKLVRARSVQEAISALEQDPEAVVVAGGSDVLIKIREGKLAGCSLVSIHGVRELEGVSLDEDGTVRILPCTTFAGVTESPVAARCVPALGEAVDQAGGPQLRNVGTIGGNVCNGVTSADSASTLLTLNARLEITGPRGVRRTTLETFYRGPGRVDLAHGELLTAILIARKDYEGYSGHYIKYAQRRAMDIATLGCAVHIRLDGTRGKVEDLRLAYGVAAPTPIRCRAAEEAARGMRLGGALLETVARAAAAAISPRTSWRASKEFRMQLAEELARRAVKQAASRAGGVFDAESD